MKNYYYRRSFARFIDYSVGLFLVMPIFYYFLPKVDLSILESTILLFSAVFTAHFLEIFTTWVFASTIGKSLLGLKIYKANGKKLTFKESLKRSSIAFITVGGLGFMPLIMILYFVSFNRISNNKKLYHNMILETKVVKFKAKLLRFIVFVILFAILSVYLNKTMPTVDSFENRTIQIKGL